MSTPTDQGTSDSTAQGNDVRDGGKMSTVAHAKATGDNKVDAARCQRASNRSTSYTMDPNKRRGKFIIINNKTFDKKTRAPVRHGTDVDAEKLEKVFGDLGFDVKRYNDVTADGMVKLMETAAQGSHDGYNCFGVAVLTHGSDYDVLFGKDGITTVEKFCEPIKNCETLRGKPKLFFFQACRGEKLIPAVAVKDSVVIHGKMSADGDDEEVDDDDEDVNPPTVYRIPREADFLYAYSTPARHFSWRNDLNGSWFIQSLCDQLDKHKRDLDLSRIMTRVNEQVAYDYESNCKSDPALCGMKQIPSIVSMLTKDLYFYPPQ
jgi:hypothetical protein